MINHSDKGDFSSQLLIFGVEGGLVTGQELEAAAHMTAGTLVFHSVPFQTVQDSSQGVGMSAALAPLISSKAIKVIPTVMRRVPSPK